MGLAANNLKLGYSDSAKCRFGWVRGNQHQGLILRLETKEIGFN